MFGRDVGKTLKVLANIVVWLFTGLGALCGLAVMLVMAVGRNVNPGALALGVLGMLLITGVGFGIGWLTSVMLYAFGNLVSNTQKISDDLDFLCSVKEDEIAAADQARARMANANVVPTYMKPKKPALGWKCVHCGAMNPVQADVCSACHKAPEGI